MFELLKNLDKRIHIAVVVLVCLLLFGIASYFMSPMVEASVDSVVYGYDGASEYEEKPSSLRNYADGTIYDSRPIEYTLTYYTGPDSKETVYGAYDDNKLYINNNDSDQVYVESVEGGYRKYTYTERWADSTEENFDTAIYESEGDKALIRSSFTPRDNFTHLGVGPVPEIKVDDSAFWIHNTKFRQTGEDIYKSQAVDVYKAVSGGEATAYVDRDSYMLVYVKGDITYEGDDSSYVRPMDYELEISADPTIQRPDWVSVAQLRSVDDADSIEASLVNYEGSTYKGSGMLFIEFKPFIKASDEVDVTVYKQDEVIASETVSVGDLEWGLLVLENGSLVRVSSEFSSDPYQYEDLQNSRVVVNTGEQKIVIDEFPYSEKLSS